MAYTLDFSTNDTIILSSQNPAAFLTLRYYDTPYWIVPDCSNNNLLINGLTIDSSKIGKDIALELNSTNNVATFQLFTQAYTNFDANLYLRRFDSSILLGTPNEILTITIKNRPNIIPSGTINVFTNDAPLIENETSYSILRTNPKFSGNIKVIVDENSNIYLDTFKVSQILSNRLYRKQQVSANSVFSGDVHDIFNSLPVGELYKLDSQDPLNISIPKIDINQQYSTTYNYGARLFKDDLYTEDYAMLAPLWINSKLPDYFAIFRLDGVYNSETYELPLNLDNLATSYFENSNLIKSWSIKTNKPLGKYLHNHLNELIQNPSPVYLSLNEYDPNTWYGIAVNKGIIVGRSEVPYFFNQIASNFTELNAFVSAGFERQNLLCPNLINLEYAFNDNDASLYSMHRYFGLYLSENELYKIAYYADSSSGSVSILSLDGKDSSALMHSLTYDGSGNVTSYLIFDGSGNISTQYKNRIFVLNDGEKLTRITNVNQINGVDASQYLNTIQDNIFNVPVTKKTFNPFITIKLNEPLDQGDHLRIIKKDSSIVWEAYGIGGDVIKKGECWPYATMSDTCTNHATIYRIAFSVDGSISDQTNAIEKAFDLFSEFEEVPLFRIGIRKDDSFSIILNENSSANNYMFQRITSHNSSSTFGQISLFGVHTTNASDYITMDASDFYGPVDFEFYGPRKTLFCDFIYTSNYLHSLSSSVIDKIESFTFYQGLDKWYRKIMDFDVSIQSTHNLYNYVYDPLTIEDNIIVMSNNDIKTVNGWWNAYNIKPLSISLMGVNPVKDIDYTVYDSSNGINKTSDYWYHHDNDASTYEKTITSDAIITEKNSYAIISGSGTITIDGSTRLFNATSIAPFMFNTFETSAQIVSSQATLTYNVLNGTHSCLSYDPSISEENLYDYYLSYDPCTAAGALKYSLTVPQVSKWSGLGNDCRNNPFRLILSNLYANKTVNNSNFIPLDSSNFSNEISYPSYKYLSSGIKNWKDYIYYDLSDVVEYTKNDTSTYTTIKKLIFNEPTLDVFSKLMYSNYDVAGSKTRSSIVYYNEFKQSIDTIAQGLSFSLKVQSIASAILNIKNYDRYRFGFITTTSRNYNNNYPIEIIINENTKTILMIWYQGNDELAYSKRNSTLLGGKSFLVNNGDNYNFQGFSTTDVSKYSYVKTPFYLNTNDITLTVSNVYLQNASFNSEQSSPVLQQAYNIKNTDSNIFNGFGNNYYTNSSKILVGYSNSVYTTFPKQTEYLYDFKLNTIGKGTINHAYKYSSNLNLYNNTTCDIDMFKYLLNRQLTSNSKTIYYHIIRGNEVFTSDTFISPPLVLSINTPSNYNINSSDNFYTYNGWYLPKFNNILEFDYNEEPDIINTVKKDFILSNTNLNSYNSIPQYWYNKVVSTVSNYDVSTKNAIGYIEDYNIFKSQWDAEYYIKDGSLVNGYSASQELPSFFGSKLIKLPEAIVLDTWDTTSTTNSYANQTITLTYNLSKSIQNLFKNNQDFLNNWSGLPNYTESDIDNYIINTILTYYNISFSKIKLNIYTKAGTNIINYTYESIMNETNQNFDAELSIVNGDYVYEIKINNVYTNYLAYYVKFTLFEI